MNTQQQLTVEQVQRLFGCSWDALAKQYSEAAETMRGIAAKAHAAGKKYRCYTAEHATRLAADMADRAQQCALHAGQ